MESSAGWKSRDQLRHAAQGARTSAAKLRRLGCTLLRFGMESASPSVLKRMRKPHRAEGAAEVLEQMKRHGILSNIGLMVGFPQETDEELEETCVFLRNHQTSIHEVEALSIFYMKPLSEVEQHPHRFAGCTCATTPPTATISGSARTAAPSSSVSSGLNA